MRIFIKALSLLLIGVISGNSLKAQVDPHFSQYYVYPSWLNPALTGVFDGNYRVAGIYRNQWGNISSPFSTPGVAVDFTTDKDANFGVSLLNQKAGDGGYSYTTAYGNAAYTGVRFGRGEFQRVVIGMQFGFIQRRFDAGKLTFGDQWNPVFGYNPSNPTAELLSRKSSTSFDAGAGVLYYDAQPGKKANFFGGFAISHLTGPNDRFSASGKDKLPARYTFHAGLRIAATDMISITPNALYLSQGTASETMLGAYASFKVSPVTDFLAGANYRFKDAFAPYIGFTHKNMVLGASYDINTSDLGKMVNGTSSFEISLSFIGRKTIKTPEAEFVCPRL